ncbi:hypothetical protein BDN70DRAFT_821300, partial [Pholiota conissans]
HGGTITQVGLNLAARHARVLGWAVSFVRKLDATARTARDTDVVGAVSITWSMIRAAMPVEILAEVDRALAIDGLPRLATRSVRENKGRGFHITVDDVTYQFPVAERAPPEAYLAVGYQACVLSLFWCNDAEF